AEGEQDRYPQNGPENPGDELVGHGPSPSVVGLTARVVALVADPSTCQFVNASAVAVVGGNAFWVCYHAAEASGEQDSRRAVARGRDVRRWTRSICATCRRRNCGDCTRSVRCHRSR